MATRVNRKNAAAAFSKEVVAADKSSSKNDPAAEPAPKTSMGIKSPGLKTSIAKKIAKKTPSKKILKKPSMAIKLKAKAKKPIKMNPKLAKTILQNVKTLENRKKLIKNGVKEVKPRKRKAVMKKEKDDSPPVLEPIFPIEENVENKKQPKKRLTKKTLKTNTDLIDVKKIKVETDDNLSVSSDVTDISNEIPNLPKQVRKSRAKKPKVETDTLEDVMNDLSFLIKGENDSKKDIDSMSESGRSDTTTKPKKLTKRQRIELLKKKIIKKENLENTLSKLDSADEKVIDMLDLNVRKVKKKLPLTKRRHSIEKFPMSTVESSESAIPQLSLFNHLPRSISPRSKRNAKVRQSVDGGVCRRSSPYSTRSDSPARMLRNGKQRKLKDMNLFEGLDSDVRKRKRLCSDLSGSEMSVSRSGYESDSSFSDLASLAGDSKDLDMKNLAKETFELEPGMKTLGIPAAVKRTLSSETASNGPSENIRLIDTNSNLCNNPLDINLNDKNDVKEESMEDSVLYPISPSMKVPEKSIILDIMKQTFNDISDEKSVKPRKTIQKPNFEADTVLVSKFYTKSNKPPQEDENFASLEPLAVKIDMPLTDTVEAEAVSEQPTTIPTEETPRGESKEKPQIDEVNLNTENQAEIEPVEESDKQAPIAIELPNDDEQAEGEKLLRDTESAHKTDAVETLESVPENVETEADIPEKIDSEKMDMQPVLESAIEEVVGEISGEKHTEMPELEDERLVQLHTEVHENKLYASEAAMTDASESAVADENGGEVGQPSVEESAEDLAKKENILKALGLQSLRAAEEAKQKSKEKPVCKSDKDNYTGTLKTVIKINRDKKKGRNSLKMTLQKNKVKSSEEQGPEEENNYKIMKDGASTAWKHGNHSSDTAGAHRKSHYSNRSNMGNYTVTGLSLLSLHFIAPLYSLINCTTPCYAHLLRTCGFTRQ